MHSLLSSQDYMDTGSPDRSGCPSRVQFQGIRPYPSIPPTPLPSTNHTPSPSASTSSRQHTSSAATPWTSTLKAPILKDFTGATAGPTCPVPNTPFEIFCLFNTPTLIQTVVDETNKYAEQVEKFEK